MDMPALLPAPVLRAEGIDFAYGQGPSRYRVLFDVSLEMPPGQLAVLTGPSGSGKTTLLTLIGGLRSLQKGRMEVLGHDLGGMSARDLVPVRRDIGFIFQMHNLFDSLNAAENVRMSLELGPLSPDENREAAHQMLRRLGLGERLHAKPRQLSGGQRQRVAIARALANRPRLVLADEPTAALDKESTRAVVALFKQMTVENGTAVLMVTHDHRIIELADRLIHMVDGRIASDVMLDNDLRIAEFLKGIEPFSALNPADLTRIAETATLRHFEPGEVIIREGDAGDELFLICEGEVEVLRHDQEVARLGPADFFGEVSLISGEPRNATVVAVEPLDAYVVTKDELAAAMKKSFRFREQLRRFFVRRR
ncbi:MAG TPA: ATP-binding cassette domain-containing protein [Stellaceae bacterium]|jgi:putative ABC transport system ATP-binding protein|nr:ATP-binding cassette domain-containing protein [Stellaceae bacterium]